jgi:hypothetical protein
MTEDRRARMERDYEAKKKIYRDLDWLRSRIGADEDAWVHARIAELEGRLKRWRSDDERLADNHKPD